MKFIQKFAVLIVIQLLVLACLPRKSYAQSGVVVAGRASTFLNPELDYFGRKLGYGAMIQYGWKNKNEKERFVELSIDSYKLKDAVTSYLFGIPNYSSYKFNVYKVSYGLRSMLSGSETGGYFDVGMGLLVSDTNGSVDEELNNTIGLTGAITPGFGFVGSSVDLGLKITFAYSDEDIAVIPTLQLGVRL